MEYFGDAVLSLVGLMALIILILELGEKSTSQLFIAIIKYWCFRTLSYTLIKFGLRNVT